MLLALAWAGALSPASAQGPSWDYIQYGHADTRLEPGPRGHGEVADLSISLTDQWFVFATGSRVEPHDHDGDAFVEGERSAGGLVGLGLHSTGSAAQWFGRVHYFRERIKVPAVAGSVREEGFAIIAGVHWQVRPWLSFEPEIGYRVTDFIFDLDRYARAEVALRIYQRLWLVGGYRASLHSGGSRASTAGLRFTFGPTPKPRIPGARAASPGDQATAALMPGQQRVATRALVLQVRPAFGAPESTTLAPGTTLTLERTLDNEFGAWWSVTADGQQGWIREGHLK